MTNGVGVKEHISVGPVWSGVGSGCVAVGGARWEGVRWGGLVDWFAGVQPRERCVWGLLRGREMRAGIPHSRSEEEGDVRCPAQRQRSHAERWTKYHSLTSGQGVGTRFPPLATGTDYPPAHCALCTAHRALPVMRSAICTACDSRFGALSLRVPLLRVKQFEQTGQRVPDRVVAEMQRAFTLPEVCPLVQMRDV